MSEPLHVFVDRLETPIGDLVIAAGGEGRLRLVHWSDGHGGPWPGDLLRRWCGAAAVEPRADPGGLSTVIRAYFDGAVTAIDPLAATADGTPFQRSVWTALRGIPCGETISYSELARRIGRPSAVRAVGLANGANPLALVVPCHRVVGADGTLTGYGGGLERKRWLLEHEAAHAPRRAPRQGVLELFQASRSIPTSW